MKYRRNNLRFLFTVLLIYLNEQLNGVNCDLSIFAQADTAAAAHAVNLYNDKLYLFSKYKICQDQVTDECNEIDESSKHKFCSDYCIQNGCNLLKFKSSSSNQSATSPANDVVDQSLYFYKKFVQHLLVYSHYLFNNKEGLAGKSELEILNKFIGNDSTENLLEETTNVLSKLITKLNTIQSSSSSLNEKNNHQKLYLLLTDPNIQLLIFSSIALTFTFSFMVIRFKSFSLILILITFSLFSLHSENLNNIPFDQIIQLATEKLFNQNIHPAIYLGGIIVIYLVVHLTRKQNNKKKLLNVELNALKRVLRKNDTFSFNSSDDLVKAIELTLLNTQSKRELELLKQIDDLKREKQSHDDLLNSHFGCSSVVMNEKIKEPPSILSSSTEDENELLLPIRNSNIRNNFNQKQQIISIGLSKTVTKHQHKYHNHSSIITYEKNLTNNQYADDDEDIVVILDEK